MTPPITICLTYFKSLALANLAAALHSVNAQDMTFIDSIVILDNNTEDSKQSIENVIDAVSFTVPVKFFSYKHGNKLRTHSWSTNEAVRPVTTPWILFTRADYILDFSLVEKFVDVAGAKKNLWNGFVTSNGCHLNVDVGVCEATDWRTKGPRFLGVVFDHTLIDAGVWMARKDAFDRVGGLDEGLTAWGHAQTHFQWKLKEAGTEMVRIPEVLFYHPLHSAERDLALANAQLSERGIDVKELWKDYRGEHPYR